MGKTKLWKKVVSCAVVTGLAVSATACGGGKSETSTAEPGVASSDTSQESFTVMGGMSALSKGYDNNEVLNKLQEDAGIKIEWNCMSDSLAEQVNIKIAGDDLPDAFMGVGFNNYDLTNYGEDGVFIDLTTYLTEEYMKNMSKILDENPNIRSAITMNNGGINGLQAGEQIENAGIGTEND